MNTFQSLASNIDPLTDFFARFNFRSDLFFNSLLCRIGSFNEPNKSYLHIVHSGAFMLQTGSNTKKIDQPCVIFCPSNALHRISPLTDTKEEGVVISCISFDFGEGVNNPLNQALNECVIMPLDNHPELLTIGKIIYHEYQDNALGKVVGIHHLCTYLLICVIRYGLQKQQLTAGFLNGLGDGKIGKVLQHLHQNPAHPWQLEEMAGIAAMSRSNFSTLFKKTVGISAIDYLISWRITLAQRKMLSGTPIAIAAQEVGYQHAGAFTRIFSAKVGISPLKWLAQNRP